MIFKLNNALQACPKNNKNKKNINKLKTDMSYLTDIDGKCETY